MSTELVMVSNHLLGPINTVIKARENIIIVTKLVFSIGCYLHLEKEMATHSSTLDWKIPWTEEPGGLQSMGSLRVRHD